MHKEGIGCLLHQDPEALLGFYQRRLGLLAGGKLMFLPMELAPEG